MSDEPIVELTKRIERLETKVNLLHTLLDSKKLFIWKGMMLLQVEDSRYERCWKLILSNGKTYVGVEEDISHTLKEEDREDIANNLKIMIWAINPTHKETCFIELSVLHKLRLDPNHMVGLILNREPAMTVPIGYWLSLLDWITKCCDNNCTHGFTRNIVEDIGGILGAMCNAKKEYDEYIGRQS